MSLSRRSLLLAAAATGLAAPFVRRSAAAEPDSLVLYNGQHRATTEALVAAFTAATGVAVTMRNAESPELANQIREEGARSPADVFYAEQAPPIASLEERGLLLPLDAATLDQIAPRYNSSKGEWVGSTIRTRVIGYNKAMINPDALPKSVMDMATPAWKGRVGWVAKDGFQEQVMAVKVVHGRDAALAWLKGLKENGQLYNSNSAAMRAVEAGEIATCLTNNYYWYGMAKERGAENMKSALYYVPKDDVGALRTVSAAGVLKTTKKPELAQKFVAFMVSEPGQQAVGRTVAEYLVRPGVASAFALPPLDLFDAPVTAAQIGDAADAYAMQREAGVA